LAISSDLIMQSPRTRETMVESAFVFKAQNETDAAKAKLA
jgi:hypothetical protein